MDIGTLALTVQQLTPIFQQYGPIFLTQAVESLAEKVPEAVGKLWQGLKTKFDTKASAKEALTDLLQTPDDADLQAAFRVQLKKLVEEDATFSETLQRLLKDAQAAAPITYQSYASGGSAVAQGAGAKSVGKGGILIEGGVKGDFTRGSEKKEK